MSTLNRLICFQKIDHVIESKVDVATLNTATERVWLSLSAKPQEVKTTWM